MQDVIERFSSVNQLVTALRSRNTNKAFSDNFILSSMNNDVESKKTSNYAEAEQLLINGYTEPVQELKKAELSFSKARKITTTTPIGYAPHVPNAIRGLPNSMLSSKTIKQPTKTIDIYYSISVSCNVKPLQMVEAGKKLLSVINLLESQNYKIRLNVLLCGCSKQTQKCCCVLCLKNYNEKLNYLKVSFPIVHPSALRRIGFRWLETTPQKIYKAFSKGYGLPLFPYELKEVFPSGKTISAASIIKYNKSTDDILYDLQH